MSRYEQDKGRLTPFVPLLVATLDTAAWREMSHGARSLYIALKRRYNKNNPNNGKLYLAQRKAAKELGSHHNQIARWYRELQHYGFIVKQSPGYLGVEGKGQAPRWRLTELGYMREPPTREYALWKGDPFSDTKKTKPRAGKPARGVCEIQHAGVPENQPSIAASVLEFPHKELTTHRAGKPAQN